MHLKILFRHFKELPFKEKLFTIFILLPITIMMVGIIKALVSKFEEKRRYRRIVKKGLLWDTEYLIEKE
jgi:hypothetical protein